jgi:GH24 family phage-related lysozyme (muramidase)/murein DD-endopeptidase MepM/ murein hydrolase activator NlpD
MNKNIKEEVKRILEITFYEKSKILESDDHINKIMDKKFKKEDDPKKADLVSANLDDFYKTLEDAASGGGLSQQKRGSMEWQKGVEAMQIGLVLLGYELPNHGVDGLFGPETARAVQEFKNDHLKSEINESVSVVSSGGNIIGNPGEGTHAASDWASGNAWDVAAQEGTKVYSITNGKVRRVLQGTGKLKKTGVKKIYGDQLSITSTDGKPDVFYTHIETNLKVGDKVNKGDVVGTIMKYEGIPTHVHIGLSYGNLSDYTDLKGTKDGKFHDEGSDMKSASPEMLKKMVTLLKDKKIKSEDVKKLLDKKITTVGLEVQTSGDWVEITKSLLRKYEGFLPNAKWDENAYRGGYGTDKKLINGRLTNATQSTTWTRKEAEETMEYELKNTYGPIVINQLGSSNWDKLNDKQKASLVSLGYNAGPYFLTKRSYGKEIKKAIENDDLERAAYYIERGPVTGSSSGKRYSGLVKRREQEANLFLA